MVTQPSLSHLTTGEPPAGERRLGHNIKRYFTRTNRTDDEAASPAQMQAPARKQVCEGSAKPLNYKRIRLNTPRPANDTTCESPP